MKSLSEPLSASVEDSDLLPNPLLGLKLTWDKVKSHLPKTTEPGTAVSYSKIREILAIKRSKKRRTMIDDELVSLFPPRAKVDLAIRRSRMYDFITFLPHEDVTFIFDKIVKVGYDYIFVMNILAATSVMGRSWLDRMHWLGVFDGSIVDYVAKVKDLSNIIKAKGIVDPDPLKYVECVGLTGYRNPPFPGFDPLLETEKLAKSGEPHNMYGYNFSDIAKTALTMKKRPLKHPATCFEDFVVGGRWQTAGSSSVGHMMVEIPGKDAPKRIKARKNTVADVVDLKELAKLCMSWDKQENHSILKSELGKIRIAVSSDLPMYLQMSWALSFLNGAYNDWPGSTTDEDFVAQTKRMYTMLSLLAKRLGLPFDYDGFDHQPNTEELVTIVSILLDHAFLNVPDHLVSEFTQIRDNILVSFRNSTLSWTSDGEVHIFDVEGGLMSGLRVTSLVGNAWNSIMTFLVMVLLKDIGYDIDAITRYIRGDDSAIYVPDWSTGAMFNEMYKAIGVRGGFGKFALLSGNMEFLRVWYSDRCSGYPLRSIPGLTQRKPWSDNPWSEDMVVRAIFEVIKTLRRRAIDREVELDRLWVHLKTIWCRNHHLPIEVTAVAAHLGGYGIESPIVGRIVPPVRFRIDKTPIKVVNQTSWRADRMTAHFKDRYAVNLPKHTADRVAGEQLISTLATDDLKIFSKNARTVWKKWVLSQHFVFEEIRVPFIDVKPSIDIDSYSLDDPASLLRALKAKCPRFGSHPQLVNAVNDYKILRPGISMTKWLEQYYPGAASSLRAFHPSWYIGEKIDYLTGTLPVSVDRIHPQLVNIFQLLLAGSVLPHRRYPRLEIPSTAKHFEFQVWNSTLSRRLYSW
jgi:hypothetical protein